nr:hypothetical protein [Tanacetum cinerariifolium]
ISATLTTITPKSPPHHNHDHTTISSTRCHHVNIIVIIILPSSPPPHRDHHLLHSGTTPFSSSPYSSPPRTITTAAAVAPFRGVTKWVLDSFDIKVNYGKTRDDPYSRRFDEYKKVFDNEIVQFANEYDLRIGNKGFPQKETKSEVTLTRIHVDIRRFFDFSRFLELIGNIFTSIFGLYLTRLREDRLKLKELMELCTKLSDRVLDLKKTKTAQAKEIANVKKKVKKLERKRRSRTLGMNLLQNIFA